MTRYCPIYPKESEGIGSASALRGRKSTRARPTAAIEDPWGSPYVRPVIPAARDFVRGVSGRGLQNAADYNGRDRGARLRDVVFLVPAPPHKQKGN